MCRDHEDGIKEGERRAECRLRSQNQSHYGAPQPRFPSAQDMATYCYQRIDDLNDWEAEFITNMMSWTRRRPLSVKQQARLEEVYLRLGGRI